jgi:predicted GH43/DUF377 family glycosyl hydrolase
VKKIKFTLLLLVVVSTFALFNSDSETILPLLASKSGINILKETRSLTLSGHKVFNASVLPLENGYLFATRKRGDSLFDYLWKRYFLRKNPKGLVIGELDIDFQEKSQVKTVFSSNSKGCETVQYLDPRLIQAGEDIYMIYCRQVNRKTRSLSSAQQYLAKLEKKEAGWIIATDVPLTFDAGEEFYNKKLVQKNFEKNWMPFVEDGDLFFIYLIAPEHIVLKTDVQTGISTIYSRSTNNISCKGSGLRGSTPAVFDKELGEWITIYHFVCPTKKDTGKKALAYFMGGYTYSKNYPYNILRMTEGPLMGDQIYQNGKKIVFPTSLIRDGDDYLIVYGSNDNANRLTRVSRKDLINSMKIVGGSNE